MSLLMFVKPFENFNSGDKIPLKKIFYLSARALQPRLKSAVAESARQKEIVLQIEIVFYVFYLAAPKPIK